MSQTQTVCRVSGKAFLAVASGILVVAIVGGCRADKDDSKTTPQITEQTAQSTNRPTALRPRVPAPSFSIPYQDNSLAIVVTEKDATDAEIESIMWRLRDAVQTHSLSQLKISQALFDERNPLMDFDIYRGTPRCAIELVSQNRPHCGRSEDMAGDYSNNRANGTPIELGFIFHNGDYDHPIEVWDRGSAYIHPSSTDAPIPSTESTHGTQPEQQVAAEFSAQVWAGGRKALFRPGKVVGELDIVADWLVDDSARKLMRMGLQHRGTEACNAGYRRVRLSAFDGTPIDSFGLKCR